MYDPEMTQMMEEQLTSRGVATFKTAEAVSEALEKEGTALVIVNSVCGCAAGNARPGALLALQHTKLPNNSYTVFAGVDHEQTAKAREYFTGEEASSPSIALLKDGKLVHIMHRKDLVNKSPEEISSELIVSFEKHC